MNKIAQENPPRKVKAQGNDNILKKDQGPKKLSPQKKHQ